MNQILLSFIIFSFCVTGFSKEVALTFDDSPRFAKGLFKGPERAKQLIEALKKAKVKEVAFFSVSKNMDEEGEKRLEAYSKAGHIIANHTHSHPNINKTSLKEYKSDFLAADKKLAHFKTFKKWFRFPYLREGNTRTKRDGMRETLKEKGYLNAYITIDNYDWYMESLFQKALASGKKVNMEKMKKFYVDTLVQSAEYYDKLAIKHLKRSPKHVFLLHEMDITALFIDDLVEALRKKGWKIISPSEAYKDPLTEYHTARVMKYNPGRVGEFARDQGQKKGLWDENCDEAYLEKRFNREVL